MVRRSIEPTAPPEAALRRRFRIAESGFEFAGRSVSMLHPANSEELIDEEAFERDERLPYWADVWPSAIVLAAHVLGNAPSGETALELGCGCGLVAACASMAGFDVTATDYYEDALAFTGVNVFRNSGQSPRTAIVDWRRFPEDFGRFDLVLASDVLYEREYADLVARAISVSLAPAGTAIVADPGRLARGAFLESAGILGLEMDTSLERSYGSGDAKQRIALLRFRWR